MDILLTLLAIGVCLLVLVHVTTKSVRQLLSHHGLTDTAAHTEVDRPVYDVAMAPSGNGAPKMLIELAENLASRAFTEVHLRRESLMDQPVGWVLWIRPEAGLSEAVTLVASHESPTIVNARMYQNHQPMSLQDFGEWVDGHPLMPTSVAILDRFTAALRNEWSATVKRRREGSVHSMDLRAEATPFAEPEAEGIVIDMLHNAHTGIEDLRSFRNGEPIENTAALRELNHLAPKSLPTLSLKG